MFGRIERSVPGKTEVRYEFCEEIKTDNAVLMDLPCVFSFN